MKRAPTIDTPQITLKKGATKRDQIRTVALPKATPAQEQQVKFIREWEARSERMLLAGDRARS